MAMKTYKWLLFDLDGTIIFSHPGIFSCAKKALAEMGEKTDYSDAFLRQMVGPPLEYTFEFMFGLSTERALEATKIYRKHYAVTGVNENELIPGMKEALCALQKAGYVLGMATSKPQRFADQIAQRLQIAQYFEKIVGCGLDGSLPTKADVIQEALKQLGASKEQTLMIGDRYHDFDGAKETGLDCALIRVGYAEEGEIERCGPKYDWADAQAMIKGLL
jgi:phosphoglycolate phosphatase